MTTQTLLSSVGLRRYTLPRPPPPHLTSTPAPLPFPTDHYKTTHRMDMPLPASFSSGRVHGSRPLKHGAPASGAADTPSRVPHNHLPLYFQSSTCRKSIGMDFSGSCRGRPVHAFTVLKHASTPCGSRDNGFYGPTPGLGGRV